MCGLFGIISSTPLTEKEKQAFELGLLCTNFKRGPDSTGILKITGDELDHEVHKSMGLITHAVNIDKMDVLLDQKQTPFFNHEKGGTVEGKVFAVLGHGRKATQGKVNIDNAHPFEFGNAIGAHNGTIPLFYMDGFAGKGKLEIDSQILINEIDHLKFDVPAVYEKIDGAAAVWVFDKHTKNIHLFRNKDRSLYLIKHRKQNKWLFSSELWLAEMVFDRYGLWDDWEFTYEKDSEKELPTSTLHTFSFDQKNKVTLTTEVMKEKAVAPFQSSTKYGTTSGVGFKGAQKKEERKETSSAWKVKKTGSLAAPTANYKGSVRYIPLTDPSFFSKNKSHGYVWDDHMKVFVALNFDNGFVYPYHHFETHPGTLVEAHWTRKFITGEDTMILIYEPPPKLQSIKFSVPKLEKKDWIQCIWDSKGNNGRGEFKILRRSRKDVLFNFEVHPYICEHVVKDPNHPFLYFVTRPVMRASENSEDFDIKDYYTYSEVIKAATNTKNTTTGGSVVTMAPKKYKYQGLELTYLQFKEIIEAHGECVCCGHRPKEKDWDNLEFYSWDQLMCPDCSSASSLTKQSVH